MLRRVAEALRPLDVPVVFVGGATIALYLEPYAASQMRVTLDVDCVAATSTLAQHQELEAKLRKLGFRHCLDDDAPICRWRYEELIVDVMPLDASVLGFGSRFSQLGFPLSEEREIAPGTQIHVLPPRYLFASKIEAYRTRGTRDPYESKDLEDLVSLLDGAPAMIDAIESENDDLRLSDTLLHGLPTSYATLPRPISWRDTSLVDRSFRSESAGFRIDSAALRENPPNTEPTDSHPDPAG